MTTAAPNRGSGAAVLMVLGSCTSLQVGAACAARLFPVIGSTAATFLRLAVAAVVVLLATRPRVRAWSGGQWRSVVLFGLSRLAEAVQTMAVSTGVGVFMLLGSLLGMTIGILFARIVAEFVLIVFRINEHLGALRTAATSSGPMADYEPGLR